MEVRRRWQSGNGSNLHSIGESSTSAVAVEDLDCISDIARRVLFLNGRGQGVCENLGLPLRRARWLGESGRWLHLPNGIPAVLHLSVKTSADTRRPEIAHGLAVCGACGYGPSQRDPVSLAAGTDIGRRQRKFKGWRQRGTSLSASGEQDEESRSQTEVASQGSHRKRKSIRGALRSLLRNQPVETRRAASQSSGGTRCAGPDAAGVWLPRLI